MTTPSTISTPTSNAHARRRTHAQQTLTSTNNTELVNVKHHGRDGVTMIDRSTKYGNPFKLEKDGGDYTRQESIDAYREWFYSDNQADLRKQAKEELTGKTLGCWCTPKPYYGDAILAYLNGDGS